MAVSRHPCHTHLSPSPCQLWPSSCQHRCVTIATPTCHHRHAPPSPSLHPPVTIAAPIACAKEAQGGDAASVAVDASCEALELCDTLLKEGSADRRGRMLGGFVNNYIDTSNIYIYIFSITLFVKVKGRGRGRLLCLPSRGMRGEMRCLTALPCLTVAWPSVAPPTPNQPVEWALACHVQVEGGTCHVQVEGVLAKSSGCLPSRAGACKVERVLAKSQPPQAKKCESKCESQRDNCESWCDNCESMHDNCESDAQMRRDEL
jgi:hypothetical protein